MDKKQITEKEAQAEILKRNERSENARKAPTQRPNLILKNVLFLRWFFTVRVIPHINRNTSNAYAGICKKAILQKNKSIIYIILNKDESFNFSLNAIIIAPHQLTQYLFYCFKHQFNIRTKTKILSIA